MIEATKIWRNGELIDWQDATIHVMTHALHYGSGCFEGIRCYKTERGPEIFRLRDHVKRLYDSTRIYHLEIAFQPEELEEACLATVRANNFDSCYLRPLIFRGVGKIGVNPVDNPTESYIIAWKWGKYLGPEALEQGVDVCVSSWRRVAPDTAPAMAKATANYGAGGLIKMEAIQRGFVEGIALDSYGFISEGSGENIFLLYQGRILTPGIGQAILPGITRDSVMRLAREMDYEVVEQALPRELLYLADEVFMTGTAAEITPVRSVDRIDVGNGRRGPVTARLQEAFFNYVEGRAEDRFGWMTAVHQQEPVRS